jgi:hypothetical protein
VERCEIPRLWMRAPLTYNVRSVLRSPSCQPSVNNPTITTRQTATPLQIDIEQSACCMPFSVPVICHLSSFKRINNRFSTVDCQNHTSTLDRTIFKFFSEVLLTLLFGIWSAEQSSQQSQTTIHLFLIQYLYQSNQEQRVTSRPK